MNEHLAWYVSRSSGIIAWAILTLSLLWGLTLSTKKRPGGARPAWLLDFHRYLAAVGTTFVVVHVIAIVADSYTHFGWSDTFVPFASIWRPQAVAWGIAGMYLLAAVQITSYFRSKMPRKVWKLVHFASFPLYIASTAHLVTAGSEAAHPLVASAVWASAATVSIALVYRISTAVAKRPDKDPFAATAARHGDQIPNDQTAPKDEDVLNASLQTSRIGHHLQ